MPEAFTFTINTPQEPKVFILDAGTSIMFVGANGSGKTRLAAKIEDDLKTTAHRIAAHRALSLNTAVPKINELEATNGLRYGHPAANAGIDNRIGSRWDSNASTTLLNDFDRLIQALFANHTNITAVPTLNNCGRITY